VVVRNDIMTKIGRLTYLNCAPVYYGFDIGMTALNAELVSGVPAELNRMMARGELDITPVSAIEYARHQEQYKLIPNICLNSEGMVKSVLLVSKVRIEDLNGKCVVLTNTSATSQALLKIILAEKYKVNVEYSEMAPDLGKMLESNEAALIIGDDALLMDVPDGLRIYDIGQLWREYSGYPVIFVTFVVQKKFVKEHPNEIVELSDSLYDSLQLGIANIEKLAKLEMYKELAERIDFRDYFATLNYEFDKRRMDALLFYYSKAAKLGLCQPCTKLEFSHTASTIEQREK
jgi:chorismate dehydratase